MKLIKSKKGQLLAYFLIVAAAIMLVCASYLDYRLNQVKREQRGIYIDELIAECRVNVSAITVNISSGEIGLETGGMFTLSNKALLNFLKVKNKMFAFSGRRIREWVEFQKVLSSADMLENTGEKPRIALRDIQEVYDTSKNMIIWLNNGKAHDNNFMY